MNDIATSSVRDTDNGWEKVRIGEAYELFEDSLKDVAAWVAKARELGYLKIVLLGHSLGCNKTIYYLYSNPDADIAGLVLLSPPDMVGLVELGRYQPDHQKLLAQARKFVAAGEPRRLLSGKIWDWYELSAQTYLSLFETGCPADNLPVLRNPEQFEQLATIRQPILAIMGEHDDIEIRELHDDIELIKSKATACHDFQIRFVEGANHDYENREDQLATEVLGWLEKM